MRRQRGVTMIGWVFLLIPMALTIYAGIRIGPVCLNYWKVVQAMKTTAEEFKNDDTISVTEIRNALNKRFDIGYIESPTAEEIAVTKGENGWEMSTDYEGVAPLFADAAIVIAFKKTVPIN